MSATNLTKTTMIKNDFSELIDDDTEYSMKDMKDVLISIYKNIEKDIKKKDKSNKKTIIKNTATIVVDDSSDDDKPKKRGRPAKPVKKDKNGNIVAKKTPSPYNFFVKEKIVTIRKEQPDVPATERMSLAAAEWKKLSDDDKAVYIKMKKDMEDSLRTEDDNAKSNEDDDSNTENDINKSDEEE